MYALSKSILGELGNYRVELYNMSILSHDADVTVRMNIFGAGENECYMAEYEIETSDGQTFEGACMNQPTKEATLEMVEKTAIEILERECNQ